jgi:trk system potassium uptake protein TrkH
MTQWFGGLGVIALFVVVLPQLGIAGRQLFFAEASGAPSEAISARVQDSARRLWILYCILSLVQLALLWVWSGMPFYESICHTLTTMAAGGFSPHGMSISGYADPTTLATYAGSAAEAFSRYNPARAEWVFVVFMMLAGTSFPLLWVIFSRRPRQLFRDDEFRFYFLSFATIAVACAWILTDGQIDTEALRMGAFQSASLISSTGYASVDYNLWPASAKALLIVVMFVGGCAGSAAGGAKAIRNLLVFRFMHRELKRAATPDAVISLRYKGRSVPDPIIRSLVNVVGLYLLTYAFIGVVLVLLGSDLITGFTASLACVGNIGPGFEAVGPMANFAELSPLAKIVLTFGMWAGRLEMVTVLALLQPIIWKRLRWRGIESRINS